MRGWSSVRVLATAIAVSAVMAVNGQAVAVPNVRATDAGTYVAATTPVPGMATNIQTCLNGRVGLPPTSLDGCERWAASGPINVVLLSRTAEAPYEDVLRQTQWKPAQGGWLVARLPTRGCGSGWHATESQIELRINPVTRRHFKFIRPGCRWDGYWLTVGDAHTDLYERKRCGGDHISDLDLARDALVGSLHAGGVVTRVEYRQWSPPGTTFPDGCGRPVPTDGRVAYLWLQG